MGRWGFFEKLSPVCAIGWSPDDEDSILWMTQVDGGGFHWNRNCVRQLERKATRTNTTLKAQQLEMLGYLFELVYDLAISPVHNVSSNPGFESILGYFGKNS